MRCFLFILCATALLTGCFSPRPEPEPIVDQSAAMEILEPGLRPEILLFPEYLMMEDFELNQHGRIPESELVGGGMRSRLSLSMVRTRFMDVLDSNGWKNTRLEIEKQSFRLMAVHQKEQIEIRGVQGIGPTEIFILYRPAPAAGPSTF